MLTGEHGVGLEKRDLMTYQFDAVDLELQHRVKHAFDPDVRFNPGQGVSDPAPLRGAGARARALPARDRFAHLPRF